MLVKKLVVAAMAGAALLSLTPVTGDDRFASQRRVDVDICVYAATPSGILAAVAAAREGRGVIVVEPSRWVGGVLGAGIKPAQGCPNRQAVGGLTVDVFARAGVGPWTDVTPINPYRIPGDSSSGLLPFVEADYGKAIGEGDDFTQAHNFRFYVTKDPEKRAPFVPPEDFDPKQFELVGRYVEYLVRRGDGNRIDGIFPGWRNAGEYNYQRGSLISISPLGVSPIYQDGDYPVRANIWKMHIDYLRGLHHFLATDPRVPGDIRDGNGNERLGKGIAGAKPRGGGLASVAGTSGLATV